MKKLHVITIYLLLIGGSGMAQMRISDKPASSTLASTTLNANSLLELESSTRALLLPRLTQTQIDAMQGVPAGMLVYNSTTNLLNIRSNTGWVTLAQAANAASATNPWSSSGTVAYTNQTVGIGINNPFSRLANTSANTLDSQGFGANPESLSWRATQPGYAGVFQNSGTLTNNNGLLVKVTASNSTALEVGQGTQGANATPLLVVKSNGRVGIGTNNPFSQLANNSGNTTGTDGNGGNSGSFSWSVTQPGYAGQIYNGGTSASSNGLVVKVNSNSATAFDVAQGAQNGAATPLLTVKSSGRVGIGTSTPQSPLDVIGTISASTLNVNGTISTGTLDVNGVISAGTLGVNGAISASTLGVNGAISTGTLSASGAISASSLDVNGIISASTLNVNGTISAGAFNMGIQYIYEDYTQQAGYIFKYVKTCPSGTKVIGGGGGHRDLNTAADDIVVNYTGPDPVNANAWAVIVKNIGTSDRGVRAYVICAKVQ
ncbi:hypothetical protein IC229_24370 [Spirosoma sp. BT702]|uniref:Uncharacterized protein n=1 Tax=Spirosoma profusum TaxID=2771354 RepID=A0A926XZE2_9BACT|nr:hypothetical protein [Spirosoma profusum]MBD2703804.1 hypothetical protein [Spirosoma profusum]